MDNSQIHRNRMGKAPGWGSIGCLGLIMLVIPFLFFGISPYIHMIELIGLGIIIWIAFANIEKRGIIEPKILVVGLPVLILFIVLGLLMPRVPWLPCPSWVPRSVVKPSDYRAMERVFEKPLPSSFQITQTRYPGFDIAFNGPDGPLRAGYEVLISAADLSYLMKGLELEEEKNDYGWPGRFYDCQDLMKDLRNDMAEQYWHGTLDEQVLRDKLRVFSFPKLGDVNWISIDERTSPSLKVYLSTRVPYMKDPS